MKTKILCSLLAALFTLAIVLTGCDKAPETTSDHKTTAPTTTALTTTATIAKPTATEKTTTAAPTTTLVITSGSDVIVVYPPSPPVVEGGGEPEEPIVQTVADKNPIAVLSSFFEIDLPKDAKVLDYRHETTEYEEGEDFTKSHIYTSRLCVSQQQLQHIQDRLEKRYSSYLGNNEDAEQKAVYREEYARNYNMTGTYYSYPWQISAEDVLDFLRAIRPVQIQMEDYFIATDEHMYILITKEDGQYYLYFDGTGCTAKE